MSREGRLIWNELRTTDLDAAVAFYGEVVGWRTRPEERDSYVHFYCGELATAGVAQIDPAQREGCIWQVHFGTNDIEALRARIESAGGSAITPIMDIPHVGRLSISADPEGVPLALFQRPAEHADAPLDGHSPGQFCWAEFICRDRDRAREFYTNAFGWQADSMATRDGIRYEFFRIGEEWIAGLAEDPLADGERARWLSYVRVEDVDEAAARARSLGATLRREPFDLGGGARTCEIFDLEGLAIGLYSTRS